MRSVLLDGQKLTNKIQKPHEKALSPWEDDFGPAEHKLLVPALGILGAGQR
jgi:hypothetical protein